MKTMKYLIHSVLLMIILSFALSSCNNDDNTPTDETTKYTWYFGNFKANINGQSVEVVNRDNKQDWNKIRHVVMNTYPTTGIYAYGFYITLKDSSMLGVGLCPVKKGIIQSQGYSEYDSVVVNIQKGNKIYYPLKDPFKIEIDSVFYVSDVRDSYNPFIKGKMDGTLYNKDNMKDSIIIKNATFGVHE
jgi:hypothetical protein